LTNHEGIVQNNLHSDDIARRFKLKIQ